MFSKIFKAYDRALLLYKEGEQVWNYSNVFHSIGKNVDNIYRFRKDNCATQTGKLNSKTHFWWKYRQYRCCERYGILHWIRRNHLSILSTNFQSSNPWRDYRKYFIRRQKGVKKHEEWDTGIYSSNFENLGEFSSTLNIYVTEEKPQRVDSLPFIPPAP